VNCKLLNLFDASNIRLHVTDYLLGLSAVLRRSKERILFQVPIACQQSLGYSQ
jgi:hypothetical protein